ncbi:MAG TPA: FAD-dependent monooxygenase [Streptosporangiaceae bacterium]
MRPPQLQVAVIGAGIGGLAAAAELSRRGIAVDVYEQARELREVGAGLHLGSNGTRLLHRLGLSERLREVAVRPAAIEIRSWNDGSVLSRQPMGAQWESEFGAPYYTLHRADLHRMLAELVPAGRLHLGCRLTDLVEDGEGVHLTFADGAVRDADLLVGADGIHSVVRAAIASGGEPVFSGNSAFRALVPADLLPEGAADTMLIWAGPDARLLSYPVQAGRMVTFVAVISDPGWTIESWSTQGDVADLVMAFEGWEDTVRHMVSLVTQPGRWALYDREPLQRWSTSRVTLLGDAAHPMLPHHGQGANQAIEDAVALAVCLAQASGAPVSAALRRYEVTRRPHATRVQLGSRGSGSLRLRAGDSARPGTMRSMIDEVSWIQGYDVERDLADSRTHSLPAT